MSELLWLHITSGRGPAECQLAVAKLALVLEKEAVKHGLACEVLETVEGGARDALLSALLSLEGEGASDFALKSRGSVLWICPSPLRPTHKRKNWFVGGGRRQVVHAKVYLAVEEARSPASSISPFDSAPQRESVVSFRIMRGPALAKP